MSVYRYESWGVDSMFPDDGDCFFEREKLPLPKQVYVALASEAARLRHQKQSTRVRLTLYVFSFAHLSPALGKQHTCAGIRGFR